MIAASAAALTVAAGAIAQQVPEATDWPNFGRDSGGTRFSPLTQITPQNVSSLKPAWTFHMRPAAAPATTGDAPADVARRGAEGMAEPHRSTRFAGSETTPLMVGGKLFVSTPYHEVLALDPDSGQPLWRYTLPGDNQPSLRGVAYWPGEKGASAEIVFADRIGSLYALDAATGKPIAGFGANGIVDLKTPEILNGSPGTGFRSNVGMTSPPAIYRNVIVTGSAVQEMPAKGPAGDIRGWDVRTGKLLWTFHTVPRPGEYGHDTWDGDSWKQRSGTNSWGLMTVDAQRGIVFAPVGTPSWDRYGADRHGSGLFGTSLVALDATTGKRLWHFQVVHHDLWDDDLDSPPTLVDVTKDGKTIPAVVVVGKSGLMYMFDRRDGTPIYKIEEQPVPASNVPGEQASPTQPFPVVPPPLSRITMSRNDLSDVTPEHAAFCQKLVDDNNILLGGPFLPTALNRATVNFPGTLGGVDWGGGAFDPKLGYYVVNVQNLGQMQSLVPNDPADGDGYHMGQPTGRFWDGDTRMPCQKGPWGELMAVDVNTAKIIWRTPLGVTDSLPADKQLTGRPNMGGPIITASGLIFIGATDDSHFRAFDATTGKQVWDVKLGASAHAVPMTYQGKDGKQYVVVTSTGGTFLGSPLTDDSITAFALP
ncbi:pyrroloquinoline quinone-dependent dehydrogenase [Sphingomonas koreensis]|nr:pyrroloquinoline quinone-dependent dehydrogenase [Sphingomonas koreensis]